MSENDDSDGDDGSDKAKTAATPQLELLPSRQFPEWLTEQGGSLAFSTYQAGKIFLIGIGEEGRLSIFERTFNRCMGMTTSGNSLYASTLWQLWRFENVLGDGEVLNGYDRVFVPQVGYVTGDLDIHDLAVDGKGELVFVNTLFSCLARPSDTHSFVPIWKPPFISKLAAEDRCHMNGLAMKDGKPAYVTAGSESDAADGWREFRQDGGVVIDVESNEIITRGLSMPHSPRWHDGKLYLHNSGTGEFGTIDLTSGKFEPVAFCPGYLRGLCFMGDFAIVGLSKPRDNRTFTGLALDDALTDKQTEARCALQVIDLKSGDIVHWLRIDGIVEELYDVVPLPGAKRPMAVGIISDEICRMISIGNDQS